MASYDYIDDPLTGFQNLSDSIVFDAFVPISFFKPKKSTGSLIASFYTVDTLFDDNGGIGSNVKGDDLKASAFSLFGSYDISERWAVFGLYSGVRYSGGATLKADKMFAYKGDFDLSDSGMRVAILGGAFECLKNPEEKKISVPIYAAVRLQINNTDINYTDTLLAAFDIEDSDTYVNLLIGGAVSFKLNKYIQITPYALIGLLNDYSYQVTRVVPFEEYDYEITDTTFLTGVEVSFKTKTNFITSFSIDGTVNKLNPIAGNLLNGLEMDSVSVSIGYSF